MLNRGECSSHADIEIGDIAVIESNGYEPEPIWAAQSQLFDGQDELLILIAACARDALTREASNKYECISGYGLSDLGAPILARP